MHGLPKQEPRTRAWQITEFRNQHDFLGRKLALVSAAVMLTISCAQKQTALPQNEIEASTPQAGVPLSSTLSPQDLNQLREIYESAVNNTDRQLKYEADGTVYVKTGDIPAEWLRDSSAQVRPYLYAAQSDPKKADLLKRVIERQAKYLSIDPYANAFREDGSIWERKFELDSLAYPILLTWTYWKVTGDASVFTPQVKAGLAEALHTMQIEQDHDGRGPAHIKSSYSFRSDTQRSTQAPVNSTGMIWTAFRPSDDPCVYGFLIPSEMMAVQALGALGEIGQFVHDDAMANLAKKMRLEVHQGIQTYGLIQAKGQAPYYAYEVDGFGHFVDMDDANLPSKLSAPYFGYPDITNSVYQTTRRRLLNPATNPFYYTGKLASGVGSPHTPKGMIWPLALVAQALTTAPADQEERGQLLKMILASDPGDHSLHESFNPNDVSVFTRKDFGWPNALFAEFIMIDREHRKPMPVPSIADLDFGGIRVAKFGDAHP